ncbi:MAG: hypothetical protein WBL67_18060 [Nitrososphaeraceae archaeon]
MSGSWRSRYQFHPTLDRGHGGVQTTGIVIHRGCEVNATILGIQIRWDT